jgi:hypothetical protein
MQDHSASGIIDTRSLSTIKVNVFRFKQSQDDPTLLFWRPWAIFIKQGGEWPFIFFFKLEEGKLLPNKDFGASV